MKKESTMFNPSDPEKVGLSQDNKYLFIYSLVFFGILSSFLSTFLLIIISIIINCFPMQQNNIN